VAHALKTDYKNSTWCVIPSTYSSLPRC